MRQDHISPHALPDWWGRSPWRSWLDLRNHDTTGLAVCATRRLSSCKEALHNPLGQRTHMPLLQPTARDDASAAVGAQRAEAMRVGDRLDRMEKIEVREIVHVDTILQYDNNTLAAHAHLRGTRGRCRRSGAARALGVERMESLHIAQVDACAAACCYPC